MKTILYILIAIITVLAALQFMSFRSTSNIEEYQFKLIEKIGDIEVREYSNAVFIQTQLETNKYEEISSDGFRTLAGYIFGNNSENQKIAMTSPVTVDMSDERNMYFMVPSNYSISDLPKPNSNNIKIITKPNQKVAAIAFSGWANESKIQEQISKLKSVLDENKMKHTGNFQFLGYNPPYEVINRKNEVIVELL